MPDKRQQCFQDCGIIVEFRPSVDEGVIQVTGKSVLRHAMNKNADGLATCYEALAVFLNVEIEDGEAKVVEMNGKGRIRIAAVLVDATGHPLPE